MRLAGKQIGVLIALVLGLVILFLPAQENNKFKFNPEVLTKNINETEDHIAPQTLSEWVIEGRRDYYLIDIRAENEYAQGNIKSSVNIPLEQLLQRGTLEELPEDKLILLYSNGNSHAAQAWLVMKTAGYDTYYLEGGFNHWNKTILNPQAPSPDASDDEILQYKTQQAVSNYFGGQSPSSASGQAAPGTTKKKIIRRPKKKKKLKGC